MEESTEGEQSPTFDALDLSDEVREALDEIGYVTPTPVQLATYGPAVDGQDIIVQARTGTGKTAAFTIPLVDRIVQSDGGVQALVLAPTRELALQSSRELARIGKHRGIRSVAVYGGAPMGRQIEELESGAQIVSGTPGRVLDHLERGTLDASSLKALVLDEMDEMLSMGFARELNAILERLPPPDRRQTMCFSATVDDDVRDHAERHMRDPQMVSLSSDAVGAEEVSHYVYMVSGSDRVGDLVRVLEVEDPESAIIFCNLRSETERVAYALQRAGFDADWLNGDLPQSEREKVMSRTRAGKLRYLVATDVAARGIDVSHLTHVINYSFPEATAIYVHRTGRTGRAGRTGCAISLVSPPELGRLYYLRLQYKIFPVERSLPTEGELQTRAEADRIALLSAAFTGAQSPDSLALAQRLLTHPEAERIVGGLVAAFFGASTQEGEDADEQAAAARRRGPTARRRPAARTVEPNDEDGDGDGPQRGRNAARRSRPAARAPSKRPPAPEEDITFTETNADVPPDTPLATLYLKVGRKDGARVGEIARLVREAGDLRRADVGKIRMRDHHTLVQIPEAQLDSLIEALKDQQLHERELSPQRANREPA
ncbi:MAG: DEAD/DEAH box helicase [Myxococcales bacterium]|nr:DEAD/DEAH box helicase [Myxococcales bacterium]